MATGGAKTFSSLNPFRRSTRPAQLRPSICDIRENFLLLGSVALHRFHQVRNQIRTALQRHIHLAPLPVDRLALRHQIIANPYSLPAECQPQYQQDS